MIAPFDEQSVPASASKAGLVKRVNKQRVADIIIDILAKAGVEVIFGLPGGSVGSLFDALLDRPEIRVVTTRHEAGAVFSAAGYAKQTQKIGVVIVTSGPGVLNTMTALASAYCDGLPVLIIAGEVPTDLYGKGALQEGSPYSLDVVGVAQKICKLSTTVIHPDGVPAALTRAIHTANSGKRGPVLLTIPLNVSTTKIQRSGISLSYSEDLIGQPNELICHKVARTLENSAKSFILAGSGARWGAGPAELLKLAEKLQIPVATTPKAKGVFPENHPLSVGVFGYAGNPSATRVLEGGVDTLLAIGTSLSDLATNSWSPQLRPAEHLIQIDVDATQIGRNYPVSVGIEGAADKVLQRINSYLWKKRSPAKVFGVETFLLPKNTDSRISQPDALRELQKVVPADTVYTCDIGEHLLFALHYLRINYPDAFNAMLGLSSMGSGIPSALGIKLAQPDRHVVAICGDGGFAMSLPDVATIAQNHTPITIVVMNDQRYNMVEHGNEAIYGRTPDYPCSEIDVVRLAAGLGINAIEIKNVNEIAGIDSKLFATPLILNIAIDPNQRIPNNKRFQALGAAVRRNDVLSELLN